MAGSKYKTLNEQVRERILLAAREIDAFKKLQDGMSKVGELFEDFKNILTPTRTATEKLNEALKDGEAFKAYAHSINMTEAGLKRVLTQQARLVDLIELTKKGAPGFQGESFSVSGTRATGGDVSVAGAAGRGGWGGIIDNAREKIKELSAELPSFEQQMTDIFIDLPGRIGDVFGNAVSQWDGTFKGFFKSIGQGFADLMKQIAAELIRIMIIKAITSAIGAAFGGGGFDSLGGGAANVAVSGAGSAFGGLLGGFRANGGPVAAGVPYIVGERGPELFVPPGGGRVMSNQESRQMMGNTQNMVINVHVPRENSLATPKSRRQAAEAMGAQLRRYA